MIDFTKPLVFEKPNDYCHSVKYGGRLNNPDFPHYLICSERGGQEYTIYVSENGRTSFGAVTIVNAPPKVVREVWVNIYSDGDTGAMHNSKFKADQQIIISGVTRSGYFVTEFFDDGSIKQEFRPITKV